MLKKEMFQSLTGETLEQFTWAPDGAIAGVIQIVHGMAEHIARYNDAAEALNHASFAVVGHTHAGHGEGAPVKGFFGVRGGLDAMIGDVHALRLRVTAEHPGTPYFLLGHSMGSFLARLYIEQYAEGLSGVVLSGTGHYPKAVAGFGLLLSRLAILAGQGKKPSVFIARVMSAGNLKHIENAKTPFDWLSADEACVAKYNADPLCGFPFTAYGYRDLFHALMRLTDMKRMAAIPKDLPVYLFSGLEDPVGGYGSAVGLVAAELRRAGVLDVDTRLYKGGRHEMLNEVNAAEVYGDLASWLYKHL